MNITDEKNKLNIISLGIDFAKDFCQIAFITDKNQEPESYSRTHDDENYLIPMFMYKRKENDTWYIGDEGVYNSKNEPDRNAHCIKNVYDVIFNQDDFSLNGEIYSSYELMGIFIENLKRYLEDRFNISESAEVVCTLENPDKKLIDTMTRVLCQKGLTKERIRVISHSEAFIYYVVNQKKDLWTNDVALFDFNEDHFIYRRMNENRSRNPKQITVVQEDMSMDVDYQMISSIEGKTKADRKFLNFIQQEFRKHIVSSCFLTGSGFYEDWFKESFDEICKKRRVFKGHNLFVKGACYAARKKHGKVKTVEHIFNCEGRTKVSIGLLIEDEGRNKVITLSEAGTNWYEAGAQTECIVDDVDKVQFVVNSLADNFTTNIVLDIRDIPRRPNKATRIKIMLAYNSDDKFDIVIKDLGFGEFFKSSGKVIKKTISVSNLF